MLFRSRSLESSDSSGSVFLWHTIIRGERSGDQQTTRPTRHCTDLPRMFQDRQNLHWNPTSISKVVPRPLIESWNLRVPPVKGQQFPHDDRDGTRTNPPRRPPPPTSTHPSPEAGRGCEPMPGCSRAGSRPGGFWVGLHKKQSTKF